MGAGWLAKVLRWTGMLVATLALLYLLIAVYLGTQVSRDTRRQTDAIVVLGARVHYKDGINPCLQARVSHGVRLWKDRYAPVLIMSGGDDIEDGANEADAMRELAVKAGVPPQQVLREGNSHSTHENLLFTREIMQQRGLKSVLIVTEPFHIPRAALVARELGLDHAVSPAPGSPCWETWKYLSRFFLREPLALVKNKLLGRW